METLQIVFENDELLVVDKPSGLAVQGGERVGRSVDAILRARYASAPEPPLLVHRLDKDTSGLLVVAKGRRAAGRLSAALASKGVRKEYLAICAGRPFSDRGTIDADVVQRGRGKPSLTRYRVLMASESFSVLSLELGTGRMHQIRIHLAGEGTPVLGDDKYGDFPLNKRLRKEFGLKRLLLHARRLTLPDDGVVRSFAAPLPQPFLDFCAAVGLDSTLL